MRFFIVWFWIWFSFKREKEHEVEQVQNGEALGRVGGRERP